MKTAERMKRRRLRRDKEYHEFIFFWVLQAMWEFPQMILVGKEPFRQRTAITETGRPMGSG